MNVYEKYYRRSYNALNKLIQYYKDGYIYENSYNLRKNLIDGARVNPVILKEEQNNLMFTIILSLLGLNKESMERTGKFDHYAKNNNSINVRGMDLDKKYKDKLDAFDNERVRSTDFDNWLSINVDVAKDKENIEHLKRVRNGLLHSNFYVDDSISDLSITHIKTKSYYESQILNPEFQLFVFEYFSNLERLGLTEKMFTFNLRNTDIKSREELIFALREMTIQIFDYKNLKTLAKDTPELLLSQSSDKRSVINVRAFFKKLSETKNFEDFNVEVKKLDIDLITHLFIFLEQNLGDYFYTLDNNTQAGIITAHLQFLFNPKREISNWLIHFWYLYATLYNGKFNCEFFSGDEFAAESCYPALMILKAYLVMYRMQQNNFEEIDYNNVNFNIKDSGVRLFSQNLDCSLCSDDYYQKSFDKERAKDDLSDDSYIWNKVICEVIRNSFAHGNVYPSIAEKSFAYIIELRDIDQKKGTVRVIKMTLAKFEEFLNSPAFDPKYCKLKSDALTRTRKKEE